MMNVRGPVPAVQFRRCNRCNASAVLPLNPSTALPCACKGELLVATPTAADVLAERQLCCTQLLALAAGCDDPANQDKNGNVNGKRAADKMRALASQWAQGTA